MDRARFAASDGLELAYRVDDFTPPWAPGETMVLLHPAMGNSARWFSWMPRLTQRYRVVRMDLRGHGQSGVPAADSPLTMTRLVDDVRELMGHLGIARAHLVGNSAGGYISQRLAIEHPDRVASLGLYGSTPGLKNSNARDWLPQIAEKGLRGFIAETIADRFPVGRCDPGLIEWYLDQIAQNDTAFIGRFVTLMTEQEWSDELHLIRCPTLLVIPGGGKVSPEEAYAAMRRRIPDVQVQVYGDAPHTVCDFMPDRCIDDLFAFLDEAGSRCNAA